MAQKALLVRLDKIGDLVLTLPADQQPALSHFECVWIVSKGMGFIPSHAVPQRNFYELPKEWSLETWKQLWSILKATNPAITVSFQAPWWVNLAFFLFGVQTRVGVLSKWHSFLFLNRGVRQKRSEAVHNELEYNHQLVHQGLKDKAPIGYPHLRLKEKDSAVVAGLPSNYIVIHPGMAGSARNWSTENYVDLIHLLTPQFPIVITGTKADNPYVQPIKDALDIHENLLWLDEKLNIDQLFYVLSHAKHVVAPSTGVLHLAASLGTAVTGIYSPVRVQTATRWGPKGKNTQTITPKVDCPGHFSCLYEKCPHFDCMNLVTSAEIYKTIQQ